VTNFSKISVLVAFIQINICVSFDTRYAYLIPSSRVMHRFSAFALVPMKENMVTPLNKKAYRQEYIIAFDHFNPMVGLGLGSSAWQI